LGQALVAVATVERRPLKRGLNKGECMDRLPGLKKVAIVERWLLERGDRYREVAISGGLKVSSISNYQSCCYCSFLQPTILTLSRYVTCFYKRVKTISVKTLPDIFSNSSIS